MSIVKLRSFNAIRAKQFGYKLTFTDWLILRRSPLHTHTEFEFSNGISFSATMADGAKCARYKWIDYTKHPERWDTVEIPVTEEQEQEMRYEADCLEGIPYDLKGLLSHGTPLEIIRPHGVKVWCTEAVLMVVKSVFKDLPIIPDQSHPTSGDYICRYFFENLKLQLP